MVWPMVWQVADDDQFVGEIQAMRKRVISLLPAKEADTEIKLGAGGLRDVEFSVQLLQLVHGRSDERLRLRGTFEALDGAGGRTATSAARTDSTWPRPTGCSGCWSIASSCTGCDALT